METIQWYHYLAAFFAGGFLTNMVPHFVHGISGDKFPTPFSKPHGRGLSSPMVNALWACFNLLLGFWLLKISKVTSDFSLLLIIFFLGIVSISIWSAYNFSKKDKE